MSITSNKFCWMGVVMLTAVSGTAQAGVSLDRTRLIITGKDSSASANLTNTSPDIPFLAQSWVEDSKGNKITSPLVVLPPLQRINGGQKGVARVTKTDGINQLPQDRESLFWMNVKAIPSMDKSKLSDNTLQLAIISRIKLYYRPGKLALPPDQAAEKLTFSRSGSSLTLTNPTPYYLTVTELNAGTRILENALVPPMGKTSVKLPADAGNTITYRTINDYGALTPKMNGVLR